MWSCLHYCIISLCICDSCDIVYGIFTVNCVHCCDLLIYFRLPFVALRDLCVYRYDTLRVCNQYKLPLL